MEGCTNDALTYRVAFTERTPGNDRHVAMKCFIQRWHSVAVSMIITMSCLQKCASMEAIDEVTSLELSLIKSKTLNFSHLL